MFPLTALTEDREFLNNANVYRVHPRTDNVNQSKSFSFLSVVGLCKDKNDGRLTVGHDYQVKDKIHCNRNLNVSIC